MNFVLFGLPVSLWYWRGGVSGGSAPPPPPPRAEKSVWGAGGVQRGLDRLAAARREEDTVEVAGSERRQPRGELDRARVRVGPRREEAELAGLVGAGLGDLVAAVADVHAEERAQAVEVAVAVLVPDVAAVALDDDRDVRALAVGAHAAEVQPQVALGEVLERGRGRRGLSRGHEFSTSSAC